MQGTNYKDAGLLGTEKVITVLAGQLGLIHGLIGLP
jgi:hypothetical protein